MRPTTHCEAPRPRARVRLTRAAAALTAASALFATGCADIGDAPAPGPLSALAVDHVEQAIAGSPALTVTDVRPVEGGAIVYAPLARRTPAGSDDAQLSVDVVVRNDEAFAIDVGAAVLWFSGGTPVGPVILSSGLKKRCEGEGTALVSDDPTIDPGEACRLVLLPDLKLPMPAPNQIDIDLWFSSFDSPFTVSMPLAAHVNAPPSGSYRFPARAEDLPSGQFWSGNSSGAGSHHRTSPSQMYAHDMGLVRWDNGTNAWSNKHPGTDGSDNDDYLVWGQPVYAMADGTVAGFENDLNDNPPGVKTSAGNFFKIDHGGEYGVYYHLKKGSLNPTLMTIGATVKAGDFLGEVGNSGNTDFPHLHLHVESGGVGRPILFRDMFLRERDTLGSPPDLTLELTSVLARALTWEKNIIWPSSLWRRGESGGGAISEVAIAQISGSQAVTAARDQAGNLSVSTWGLNASGAVTHLDDDSAGGVSLVTVAQPKFTSDVVTAFRNSSGNLMLIAWDVLAGTGSLVREGSTTAGAVSKVATTKLPTNNGVATAVRTSDGDLKVIAWEVDGALDIIRQGGAAGAPILDVAVATIYDPFEGVVTAARDASGDLLLTAWEITPALQVIERGSATAGAVSEVDVAAIRVGFNTEHIVTALRDGSGDLKLIAWEVSAAGQITRLGDAAAGAATKISVASNNTGELVTGFRSGTGKLELIAWRLSAAGEFTRNGEDSAGNVSQLDLTRSFSVGGKRFAMPAVRDSLGDLEVIAWQVNL
ncbi:M23 family metallopeptidase [Haliangium sp.]|uniref:M23 family metallopeptidase n=1 Tax=Haliangium sp. TaxID=2663208 RepID=UPI003D0B2F36